MLTTGNPYIDGFTGTVLQPDDDRYDEARRIFNGMIDRRPALIARPRDTDDVAAAVREARRRGLDLAVRAGGHSGAGFSMVDDALVIDLRELRDVDVDASARTVRAGAGLLWADLDAATQEHGLAVTGGRVSSTGVAGLTLGSGSGWLERVAGLTADNLLGATVVTADGEVVRCDAHQHPELLWALRGGGGNFGIVTELELRLHPVTDLTGGLLVFPWDRAREVLAAYREIMAGADRDLGGAAVLQLAPPAPFVPDDLVGTPVLSIVVAAFAEPERAEALVAPLRALRPLIDVVAPMPYVALQSMLDEANPHGMRNRWRAAFLDDLPDAAIDAALEVGRRNPSPLTVVILQPLGGAYAEQPEGGTALVHRDARWAYHCLGMWPAAEADAENVAWVDAFAAAMAPFGAGAAHPNYVSDDRSDRVRAFYGDATYERLVAVKDRWDPENVFRHNQNIRPSR